MNLKTAALLLGVTAMTSGIVLAQEDDHRSIPHLDHVYLIMMENHHISQILGNPNAPFITSYTSTANLANNYFAVGHPSLTNYLETVGGSNFGIVNDNSPAWHLSEPDCINTLATFVDETATANACPISGSGIDAATPAVDTTNEGTPTEPIYNTPFGPAPTVGVTIADQLVEKGLSWKAYEENLPPYGADQVNNSDGLISDNGVTQTEPFLPKLYAVKHDPFVYFASVEEGTTPGLSMKQIADFGSLYADLAGGHSPNFSYIVPNQCHDQHARGTSEVGTGCSDEQSDIATGDAAVATLISSIKGSKAWKEGKNAIVLVWDENDYSSLPNQVILTVDTNYSKGGKVSTKSYNHYSLLKSIETGFGLSYINHAADKNVKVMSDLFAK